MSVCVCVFGVCVFGVCVFGMCEVCVVCVCECVYVSVCEGRYVCGDTATARALSAVSQDRAFFLRGG